MKLKDVQHVFRKSEKSFFSFSPENAAAAKIATTIKI
jgi:hypothetical protein